MSRTQTAVTTGGICCCAMLAILAASKPITAQAQIKPTVTVVNPVSNPVNARITNSVVPVDFGNASQYTHVGQKPSRVVNLVIFTDRSRRIDPVTAQADSESFQVPEGFVFVLTDIQMFNACAPGTEVGYALRHRSSVIDAPRDLIRGICPATGEVSLNRHYSTGMLFGAGSEVYIATGNVTNLLMYGQGYLVPAN